MNKKILWAAVLGIIILVFGVSFWSNREFSTNTAGPGSSGVADREVKLSDQKSERTIQPTSAALPTPTIPPYSLRVDDISGSFIILVNEKGSKLRLSNNPNMVKVFRQQGTSLVPASISDIKVGQQVTVKAVIPGKESHIILP